MTNVYGDIDFIPTEQYARPEADRAIADAKEVVRLARLVISGPDTPP